LIASLLALFSGCNQENLSITTSKPKIDETLESVSVDSIKHISNMTSIALEWQGVEDSRSQGYYIYRANMQVDGQKLKRIKTLDTRYTSHYVDTNLDPNSKYLYSISSIGQNGSESVASQTVMAQTLPRYESVSFIAAISDLPRQIKIIWRPHTNLAVKKYIVQRSTLQTSKWKNIKTITGRLNAEYIDTDLGDNEVYLYRLIALTFDGIESAPSKIVQAKTKPLPIGVQNFKATIDLPRKIELTWEPSPTHDVIAYKIYRGIASTDKFFKEIAHIEAKNNIYTDVINEDAKTEFYKITTIDKDNLESSKETTPIMGSTLGKPAKPIVTLALIEGNKAILNWIAGDNRAVSYNVIKTVQEGYFSSKETIIPNVEGLRFEDADVVRGVTYEYALEAVDANGLVSKRTSSTSIILPRANNTNE
jgi:fibronectin type 3 domain-containing protein